MRPARTLAITVGVVALLAAACGDDDSDNSLTSDSTTPGDAAARTVDIDMVDNAFEPSALDVAAGETVLFVFTNTGAVDHDAFIGDAAAQAEHEEEMSAGEGGGSGDDMDMGSDSADMDGHESEMGSEDEAEHGITVAPGETGELTHTFTEPGTLELGCHEPGHYDAGMKVTVTVS